MKSNGVTTTSPTIVTGVRSVARTIAALRSRAGRGRAYGITSTLASAGYSLADFQVARSASVHGRPTRNTRTRTLASSSPTQFADAGEVVAGRAKSWSYET